MTKLFEEVDALCKEMRVAVPTHVIRHPAPPPRKNSKSLKFAKSLIGAMSRVYPGDNALTDKSQMMVAKLREPEPKAHAPVYAAGHRTKDEILFT